MKRTDPATAAYVEMAEEDLALAETNLPAATEHVDYSKTFADTAERMGIDLPTPRP